MTETNIKGRAGAFFRFFYICGKIFKTVTRYCQTGKNEKSLLLLAVFSLLDNFFQGVRFFVQDILPFFHKRFCALDTSRADHFLGIAACFAEFRAAGQLRHICITCRFS